MHGLRIEEETLPLLQNSSYKIDTYINTDQETISWSSVLLSFVLGLNIIFVSSCGLMTTRPKLEMSLAASAFMAAKKAKSNSITPGLFRKAEHYYLKAKSSYKKKYFNKAKQYAILSKKFSERAEFISLKKELLNENEEGE